MASCVIFVLGAGIFGFLNLYVYSAIFVIIIEGIILLIFKWSCPLTIVAQNYTQDRQDNFDIFLPNFLAKHNKVVFTILFMVGLILILLRQLLN
jgi:hypothetical protein